MLESVKQAFQSVWSHKMRSFLTMLGIIIGIASIITIVSTIKGTNEQIKENLVGAGNNAVIVRLCYRENEYDLQYSALPESVTTVSEETRQELLDLNHVKNVSIYTCRNWVDSAFYLTTRFNGVIYGVDTHYFDTTGYKLDYGRTFLERDYTEHSSVCVLDAAAASSLFAGDDPIGKTIEVSGNAFVVIGVVSQRTTVQPEINNLSDYYTYSGDTSGKLFVPLSVWPVLYRFDEPEHVALQADSTDNMTQIGRKASDILTEKQVLAQDSQMKYKSEDLMEQAQQLQQLSNSSNSQLIWIAGISLIVGGIGVMNIMLVTVTERTQEIGLRKAVGARRKRILYQFLTEAAVLTSFGGLIGIIIGIVMARLISSIMGTPTAISFPAILIAVVFSMVIGILFGLLPAIKASNLNPIQALRRE